MFATPVIERFSRIPPLVPFIFWVPTLLALSGWVAHRGLPPVAQLGLLAAGWLAWSLTEYLLHRYLFHYLGPRSWQRRLHFILHGVHHDFPRDRLRLVMPLTVSAPLGVLFFAGIDALAPRLVACALFVGFGCGYLCYDAVHYFTHHLPARRRIGKYLKRFHLLHHHTGVDGLYGVSSPLWDFVFGTQHFASSSRRPPVGGAAEATTHGSTRRPAAS